MFFHSGISNKFLKLLIFNRREVSFEEGVKLAEQKGLEFIETSAKSGENIEQAFGIATSNVLKKIEIGEINPLSDVCSILQ